MQTLEKTKWEDGVELTLKQYLCYSNDLDGQGENCECGRGKKLRV